MGDDLIDRLSNQAVLKHRLPQVDDIIDDDIGSEGCQIQDPIGKAGDSPKCRGEGQVCPWRDVRDQLGHCSAFIGAKREFLQYRHIIWQVTAGHIGGIAGARCSVEAV